MLPGAEPFVQRHTQAMRGFFTRQRSELGSGGFDERRWNRVLTPILLDQGLRVAQAFGAPVARRFGARFDADEIREWLETVAAITAEYVNAGTRSTLEAALAEMDRAEALEKTFALASSRAGLISRSKVNTSANVGRQVAAEVGGARRKVWVVTSGNPRSSHAGMSGESVRIGATFSNGAKWPGDPNLSIEERAGCACFCDFGE